MGNQPNNFIQCGQDQRDNKQETLTTRQQAIRNSKNQQQIKSQFVQSKISSSKNSTQVNSLPPVVGLRQRKSQTSKPVAMSIPQHQNITKVSKTPKNKFLVVNGQLYEEERGKCLDEIIESRYNTTMHFPQYQIHGLLESLVYSLAYMVKKDVNHHDFYPTNIFYNSGAFKIANPLLVKSSGYSLTQQRKRFSFLSPELILQILNDTSEGNIRKDVMDKSDVFAIGMILLQFCTLTPSSECYDPENYSIIDEVIQQRLEKTRSLYNPLVADCIDIMLQYEVDKRIAPIDLAYAVHSKIMEVRTDEVNEMSRVNQLSRLAMSKSPQIPPQALHGGERILPQNRPGSYTQPPIQMAPQQFMVSSNPKISQPNVINPNVPQQTYYNLSSNLAPYPQIQNFQGPPSTFANPQQKLIQPGQILNMNQGNSGFKRLQNSYYVTSEAKNISPPKYYRNTQPPLSSLPPQNLPAKQNIPTMGSNTKLKLNPFEEIQQDVKEDEDQSPHKDKTGSSTNNQTKIKEKKQQALSQSPKFGTYKFKTVQPANLSSAAYLGSNNQKEESLDERVKRILQASKNIK